MEKPKRKKLERAGWKVGDAKDFLDLSEAESAIIDIRVSLARELRRRRLGKKVSQAKLAERIGSSQSRVAKIEAGDPSVSFELLVRSLLGMGSSVAQIGAVIAKAGC